MTDEEEEDPEREGLIRSQTENYNGASDMIEGLIEEGELPVAEDGDEELSTSLDRTINYELDQKTERYVRAPGVLEGVNASLIINQNAETVPAEDQIVPIVRRAIGLDDPATEIVGDVTFEPMPFADGEDIEPIGEDLMADFLLFFRRYWPFMIGGIILLITAIVILIVVRRGKNDDYDEFETAFENQNPTPLQREELAPIEPDPIDLNIERKKQKNKVVSDKEDTVREEAKQNPELAAELMKIWLKE